MKRFLSVAIVFLLMMSSSLMPWQIKAEAIESNGVRIEAEDYESCSSKDVELISNDLREAVFAKEPDSFEYVENFAGGSYLIKFNGATISDSLISISQDGEEVASLTLNPGGAYENNCVFATLKGGITYIEVAVKKGEVCIDYIEFSPISENISFVSSINNAKTVQEVKSVYKDNEASLGISTAEIEKGIFYPDVIYASLIGKQFDSLQEIIDLLSKNISKEVDYPKVSLKSGTKKLTTLSDGDLKVTLTDIAFAKYKEIYAVIYKDGAEEYRQEAVINGNNAEMYFYDVELLEGSEYMFEVFVDDVPYKDVLTGAYRNIYVSPDGNDGNDGTQNAPFKSLERAKQEIARNCQSMRGDIVVNVEPGYYELSDTLSFDNSNTAKNGYKVIIRGTDKDNPSMISGGTKVSGWTDDDGDGIYRAKLSGKENVRKMYVNGYPAIRAMTEEVYKVKSVYSDDDDTYSIDGITVSSLTFPYSDLKNIEEVEFVWPLYWRESRTKVKSVSKGFLNTTFIMEQPTFSYMDAGDEKWSIKENTPFYLENSMEFLDKEGEFYYDKSAGYIYYYPFDEEDMTTADVYVGNVEQLVTAKGSSHDNKIQNLVFENLEFRYGAMDIVSENGIANIQAEFYISSSNDAFYIPFQLEFVNAKGIEIRNCRFACLGSGAVSMTDGVSDSIIEQNTFRDLSGGGVMIGTIDHESAETKSICKNILIKNNVLRRTCDEYRSSVPISVYYEQNIKIISNDIKDVPYTGISAGWGWGNLGPADWGRMKISHNKIDNVMLALHDGAQIYTLGPMRKSSIDYNYLKNSEYLLSGVYTDTGSAYIDIYNNVMDDDADTYWWYQGFYYTHDLKAYDNYSRSGTLCREDEFDLNVIENHNYIAQNTSWPTEAQYIIDESGLEKKYEYLLDNMELPSWRTNLIERLPKGL